MNDYIELELNEFTTRYGSSSSRRKALTEAIFEKLDFLYSNGVEDIYIGGSFISDKPNPNDIDLVAKLSHNVSQSQASSLSRFRVEVKSKSIDILLASGKQILEYSLLFLSKDRHGNTTRLVKLVNPKAASAEESYFPLLDDYIYAERLKEAENLLQKETDPIMHQSIQKYISDLKKGYQKNSVSIFYSQCMQVDVSMPADHGKTDIQTNSLIGLFIQKDTAFSVLDFGCGQGRLIAVLLSLDKSILKKLTYVGVDFDYSRAEEYSAENGFNDLCHSVSFIGFNQLHEFEKSFDYIISINVIHEVPAKELYSVLIKPLQCLKDNGIYVIHDMERLPFGESGFVPWEGNYLSDFIFQLGLGATIRRHTTQSGIPLFSIVLSKPKIEVLAGHFTNILLSNYEKLIKYYIGKRKTTSNSSRDYGYYSVIIANAIENKYLLEVI